MNETPDISIITVNYNGFQDTCALIKSLHKHIHSSSYEIIVVDNGSRQNEANLLLSAFPSIQTIRSERNLGFAGGNNLGMDHAKGKYLFLLNNDTIIEDDSLHFLCETLQNNSKIGAVSPKIKFANPPRHIQFAGFTALSSYLLRNQSIGFNQPDQGQYDTPHTTFFLHGAALMFRREILDHPGKMPEIFFLYYEEMDWCSKIIQQGYQLWYDPRCIIYHKESSSTGQNSPVKIYYLTRNRLLYTHRNRKGIIRFIAILYQLTIANPKNIIVNLLKGKIRLSIVIFKGTIDYFFLKNKEV